MAVRLSTTLLSALAMLPAAAQAAPPAAPRTVLPIREVDLPGGVRRYSVTLTIDGTPVETQLDTGSTGLRVLKPALTGPAASATGPAVHYAYGSGVLLEGTRVPAQLGAGAIGGSVPIERVDTVGCVERQPHCPGTRLSAADCRIGGNGVAGRGFSAIVGTGFHADVVPNPLVALGVQRWIVDLPRGPGEQGQLILNPAPEEMARFRTFAVLGDSNQIPACIVRADARQRLCAPAMVDSGASGLRIQGGSPRDIWPNGTPAAIALGDSAGVAAFDVTIGRHDQASGMFAEPHRAGSDHLELNLGLAPFFHWSVLFDAAARRLGVADR